MLPRVVKATTSFGLPQAEDRQISLSSSRAGCKNPRAVVRQDGGPCASVRPDLELAPAGYGRCESVPARRRRSQASFSDSKVMGCPTAC